jgi:hypothetical protein
MQFQLPSRSQPRHCWFERHAIEETFISCKKPLTHDIYEARILTQAVDKYKVVTQMGDQGASCDGMRTMREWFEAGLNR